MASCAANGARRFLRARSIDRLTAAVTSNASFDSAAWARSYCSTLINASWTSSTAYAAETPRSITARLAFAILSERLDMALPNYPLLHYTTHVAFSDMENNSISPTVTQELLERVAT